MILVIKTQVLILVAFHSLMETKESYSIVNPIQELAEKYFHSNAYLLIYGHLLKQDELANSHIC